MARYLIGRSVRGSKVFGRSAFSTAASSAMPCADAVSNTTRTAGSLSIALREAKACCIPLGVGRKKKNRGVDGAMVRRLRGRFTAILFERNKHRIARPPRFVE
jgi:hypothetical protein